MLYIFNEYGCFCFIEFLRLHKNILFHLSNGKFEETKEFFFYILSENLWIFARYNLGMGGEAALKLVKIVGGLP